MSSTVTKVSIPPTGEIEIKNCLFVNDCGEQIKVYRAEVIAGAVAAVTAITIFVISVVCLRM